MTLRENPKTGTQQGRAPRSAKRMAVKAIGLAVLLTALGMGVYVAWDELDEHIFPIRFTEVKPDRLYRSGQLSRFLIRRVLEEHDIDVVVDLTAHNHLCKDQQAEKETVESVGLEYVRATLSGDGTGDLNNYAKAIAAIKRSLDGDKCVLVHCRSGAWRTGGVLAAYQVLIERETPEVAYRELARYTPPTVHEAPVIDYLNDNMARLAQLLVERGAIEHAPVPLPQFTPSPPS